MSHFVTVALVNADKEHELNEELERMMAPYDENMEVPEYKAKCYCVGHLAETECDTEAYNIVGNELNTSIDQLRETYQERLKQDNLHPMSEEARVIWESITNQFRNAVTATKRELLSKRDDVDSPDAECDNCHGTGEYLTIYNPKSKWDYFVIGGRYDGWIGDGKNTLASSEFLASIEAGLTGVPFALVTPDCEWHERGRMGWWAIVSDEKSKEKWRDEVIDLVKQHPNCIVVALDCHI